LGCSIEQLGSSVQLQTKKTSDCSVHRFDAGGTPLVICGFPNSLKSGEASTQFKTHSFHLPQGNPRRYKTDDEARKKG
jgi:hypothetical protein